MAKTPVSLAIQDFKEREVMHVHYEFDQSTDREGQMAGLPRGGKITIRVKALNDGNPDLLSWMIERNLPKDGSIQFKETKTGKVMKSINFKRGYCVGFHEHWEDTVSSGAVALNHYEDIVITCQTIEFGNVTFNNAWE